jgi:hypothetical protein
MRWATRPAAVVPHDREALVAEAAHDLDLIERHRARRVIGVTLAVRRLARIAVAAQIGEHDRKVFGQAAGDLVPGDVRLRVTVQ